ncbi:MAG TPA: hypothetical protein VEO95_02615 [Chthoniobacteraceae bacterium]|nr:hypothetical protein [Chthoniobacteraceae bacterium]
MKIASRSLAVLALLAATALCAPEPFQAEEAQRIAHKLNDTIGSPSDAPFATEVDPDRPHGFKADGRAALILLPDRKLTADALEKAGKEPTAIGQLWMLEVSIAASGRPVANDQLRIVRVGEGEKSRDVQLYYLGAAKNEAGELQLVIFAKDKAQPVLRVPLAKSPTASQSSPIEIEGRKQDDNSGVLTLHVLGEYTAEVPVMKPE